MKWTTPADLKTQVKKLWDRGLLLAPLAGGESLFPLRLRLKTPGTREMSERFAEPGCPPRPEMLMDAILKLHEHIGSEKLGVNREQIIREVEAAALAAKPTHQLKGLLT